MLGEEQKSTVVPFVWAVIVCSTFGPFLLPLNPFQSTKYKSCAIYFHASKFFRFFRNIASVVFQLNPFDQYILT